MTEKVLVPVLGESITEATISKWLKSKGDKISADEAIVELETDKVNLEVPSPISGILSAINFKDGDTVEVGSVLGEISSGPEEQNEVDNKNVEKPKNKISDNNSINFINPSDVSYPTSSGSGGTTHSTIQSENKTDTKN